MAKNFENMARGVQTRRFGGRFRPRGDHMNWKLVTLGGFLSAALGTVIGILVAVSLIGPEAVLPGSVAGGVAGSSLGWLAATRLGKPATFPEDGTLTLKPAQADMRPAGRHRGLF